VQRTTRGFHPYEQICAGLAVREQRDWEQDEAALIAAALADCPAVYLSGAPDQWWLLQP
jgi:hypothetical protein